MLKDIIEHCLNETNKVGISKKSNNYLKLLNQNSGDNIEFYKVFKRMRLDQMIKSEEKKALAKPKKPPIKPNTKIVNKYVKLLERNLPKEKEAEKLSFSRKPTYENIQKQMKKDKLVRKIELHAIIERVYGPIIKSVSISTMYEKLKFRFIELARNNAKSKIISNLTPW